MPIDVSHLSTAQLEALVRAAAKEKKRKQKRKPVAKVRALLDKAAKSAGYSLAEVFGEAKQSRQGKASRVTKGAGRKSSGGKVPPKYRNPEDETQTWTGRGRQPKWVAEAIANGSSLDALRITSDADTAL